MEIIQFARLNMLREKTPEVASWRHRVGGAHARASRSDGVPDGAPRRWMGRFWPDMGIKGAHDRLSVSISRYPANAPTIPATRRRGVRGVLTCTVGGSVAATGGAVPQATRNVSPPS